MWKSWARWGRAELADLLGVHRRQRAALDGSRAAILMYHRVLPRSEARRLAVEPGMYVTPASFAKQLDWLCDHFQVLPLWAIARRLADGKPLPERACAITFDDGWRDNLLYAFPELQRRKLPATIFLVSRRVGTHGAFWPDEVCRRLQGLSRAEAAEVVRGLGIPSGDAGGLIAAWKDLTEEARGDALDELRDLTAKVTLPPQRELLDWDEVAEMSREFVDFESHAASHALLTGIPREQADRELRESLASLRERGCAAHGLLAYPNGSHDDEICKLARDAGYQAAVTTERGLAGHGDALLALPRLGVHEDVSATRAEFFRRVPGPAS